MSHSLKPWNTFGIRRRAYNIVRVESIRQLLEEWQRATHLNKPVLILGEGSNILFLEDFSGTVIVNRIMGITVRESTSFWHLHTGAGENWHQLVRFTLEQNMPGLENLALIPGCAGSSPVQNIGAFCLELEKVCEYVDCIEFSTGKLQRLSVEECRFGYRDSIFKREYQERVAIVAVGLRLSKDWKPILVYRDLTFLDSEKVTPKQVFNIVCRLRVSRLPDPKIYGNAGSFFKNPIISNKDYRMLLARWPDVPFYPQEDGNVKLAAGWLIDRCQLKGVTKGGAAISYQQPLVLINKNEATSRDIVHLAHLVRKRVGEKFNVWLEPEVRFIGHTGEVNAVETIM